MFPESGRFSGHREAPQNLVLRLGVLKKVFVCLSRDVRPDGFDGPENIEQVGDLSRRHRFHGLIGGLTGGEWSFDPVRLTGA